MKDQISPRKTILYRDVIDKICSEEQIAYMQNARAFLPQLDAIADSIRDINQLPHDKVLTLRDLYNIAKSLSTDTYVVAPDYFPKKVIALTILDLNNTHDNHAIILKEGIEANTALFCIGHELGHIIRGHEYLVNSKKILNFKQYRQYLRNEFEANYIAAALLLNRNSFEKDLDDTDYNILELAAKYNLSYETIMHRIANVMEKIHFLKLNADGEIVKRFNSSEEQMFWSPLKKPCLCSSAQKVLDSKNPKIICQLSTIKDKNEKTIIGLFSVSIKKRQKQQWSINIGYTLRSKQEAEDLFNDDRFLYFKNNFEILRDQVSLYNCDEYCPLRSKLKNCPY
jgi:Zn-dependent peptidase ImmA (M78 family)